MKPETLSAALRAHRASILKPVGHVLQVVEVDGMRLSLETCLMLAAENLEQGARFDALVKAMRADLGEDWTGDLLLTAYCAKG